MSTQTLMRVLSGKFVMAVTIGGVIGLGILRTPGEIAAVVQRPWVYLAIWMVGGLFVLLTTAVAAELVGMTPRSGGIYPQIRRAYGPYPGFVIGWVDWLSFVADIALKAVVVIEFLGMLLPATASWQTALSIVVTTLFAALQLRGVLLTARLQQFMTALIGLVIIGLSLTLFLVKATPTVPPEAAFSTIGLGGWSLVLVGIVYTYDGWLFASYFSGEIRGGAGAAARSCIKGVVVIIFLYMLLNLAVVHSVGLSTLAGSELAIARALEVAVSPGLGKLVAVAAILILLGHQNLAYMGGARVLHALAEDGFASSGARRVGRGGNPVVAVILTWAVSVGLILVGGFNFLLYLCVFFFVPLYIALIAGVWLLRGREPDSPRPYRAWGHPWSTVVCLAGWGVITLVNAWAEIETAVYALGMIGISWPVYHYFFRR